MQKKIEAFQIIYDEFVKIANSDDLSVISEDVAISTNENVAVEKEIDGISVINKEVTMNKETNDTTVVEKELEM